MNLGGLFGQQKSAVEGLTELLDPKNISLKTVVNSTQLKSMFKLKLSIELRKNPDKEPLDILDELLLWYLTVLPSKNGLRSQQIVDGLKDMRETLLESELITKQLSSKR